MSRAKVTVFQEAKELATLPLDELIGKLKVYKIILENNGVTSKTTIEKVKSLALKAKVIREQTSDDSDSQGRSNEEVHKEEAESFSLMARNFHKFFRKDINDHIKEISSGSTTTHSDISLPEYDSFIFDLSNDQFPPTNRSDFTHEEFGDELAHIISPPEYDCFYFRNLPDPGELISILNSGIRENLSSTTCVNLLVEDDHAPLLAYVVWIFLAYLTYPIIPPYLHSFGIKDTIFDPGIIINRFYSFKPGLSHRCGTFKKFNTHRSHLNESTMEMLFSTCFPIDQ
nr:hypothetical protein [Tanacetum cinerariifolium]